MIAFQLQILQVPLTWVLFKVVNWGSCRLMLANFWQESQAGQGMHYALLSVLEFCSISNHIGNLWNAYRVTDDGTQTRAHLETQLASSLALKSPNEYRQCLLSYVRFLARSVFSFFCLLILSSTTMIVLCCLLFSICYCYLHMVQRTCKFFFIKLKLHL